MIASTATKAFSRGRISLFRHRRQQLLQQQQHCLGQRAFFFAGPAQSAHSFEDSRYVQNDDQRLLLSQRRLFASTTTTTSDSDNAEQDMPVEEEYKKLSQREHALTRPGMYLGPNRRQPPQPYWVLRDLPRPPKRGMLKSPMNELKPAAKSGTITTEVTKRDCEIVPALIKVFDEILVNASDRRLRHPRSCTRIDVLIHPGSKRQPPMIRVFNDGKGIPIKKHKGEKVYIPELLFGHFMTGSNFDDTKERFTGGTHGLGAKLTNIFSKEFTVEVGDSSSNIKKRYTQNWSNNMLDLGEPVIEPYPKGSDFTCISFVPDLEALTGEKNAVSISDDDYAMMCRRVVDVAGCSGGAIKVSLNGVDVSMPSFESYAELYRSSISGGSLLSKKINSKWSVAVGLSEGGFESISFVNGISTARGGKHVDAIAQQIAKYLQENAVKGKDKKGLRQYLTQSLVRQHLFVAVNALIDSPTFDSQTKEFLMTNPQDFGSNHNLPPRFLSEIAKSGLMDAVVDAAEKKGGDKLGRMVKKKQKKTDLMASFPKLEDAHDAGNPGSNCTLILTEGDSAKGHAVAGLAVVGREKFGVFPIKGKFLNVRQATNNQLTSNAELKALMAIIGLDFKKTYKTKAERQTLRYKQLMMMTDQDTDGAHIKGLLVNFFRYYWPHLLRPAADAPDDPGFISAFVTPLLKARKGKGGKEEVISFYSVVEFNKWKAETEDLGKYSVKYFKGLGTSETKDFMGYFEDYDKHVRQFRWKNEKDGRLIDMAFSKDKVEDRKKWIRTTYDENSSIYDDEVANEVSYQDFVNKELIHFSHYDNIRSIPSAIDGLKPSQRKVLYACFKRRLTKEMKVAQLSGYCAEQTAYHHGEESLHQTIINMAQNFVGSNNINLLTPAGQFGTRQTGGADAASPRYIFTALSPVTRILFPEIDDKLLTYLDDDGQPIEPQYYCPIIPMLLVNGCVGIGTGWSSKVPTYNPRDIVDCLKVMLEGREELPDIRPYTRGFMGTFHPVSGGHVSTGTASIRNSTTIEVNELPVGLWTDRYKAQLLNMQESGIISSFTEDHEPGKVSFTIDVTSAVLNKMEDEGLEQSLKLTSNLRQTNMHAFDADGMMTKFNSPHEIMKVFFPVRMKLYHDRVSVLRSEAEYSAKLLRSKARFIEHVIRGDVDLLGGRSTKSATIAMLEELGLDDENELSRVRNDNAIGQRSRDLLPATANHDSKFDYLLDMPMGSLTSDRIAKLENEAKQREQERKEIDDTTPEQLWQADLERLGPHLPPDDTL